MPIGAAPRYYLKLKAVYYYYEKDYTQTEIAQMLNVSRITLGKLLKEAWLEGMVKIDIVDQRNVKQLLELEARLRGRQTDAEEVIQLRLRNAAAEDARMGEYQCALVSADRESDYARFTALLTTLGMRTTL